MHPESPPSPSLQTATADPRESPWYPYDNGTGHFDANLAMILIFLFCALICALALNAAIRFFLRRSPSSSNTAEEAAKPANAASAAVDSPPTMIYSAGMKLAGAAAECAICLCEFVDGEGVRVLPRCNHGFHVKCIEGWLNSAHFSCPTCRSSCLVTSSPDKSPVVVTTLGTSTAPEEVVLHIEESSTPSTTTTTTTTTTEQQQQQQRRSHEAERQTTV
ncbi:hypothetical protein Syun_020063 [Stephania yunnanensis]|uniref:RING-type domain-containing protein n=1 Tax=Stephania yunnanensis TaxID=152371 RepID=A0AAP0IXN1_9MAGN